MCGGHQWSDPVDFQAPPPTPPWSWSWSTHITFLIMSIGPPIPEMRLFSNFDLENSRSRSWVWSKGNFTQWASIQLISFLFILLQADQYSPWNKAISKFDLDTFKVKVMGEVKGQGHIVNPVFNRCTSFSLHISWTNHSWDMAKSVWPRKNTSEILNKKYWRRKNCPKKVFSRILPLFKQVISMTRGI